jgi:hypothetical protein
MKPAVVMMLGNAFLLIAWLLLAASCSVDKSANPKRTCGSDDDCRTGTECYKGFCVAKESAGSSGSGGKGGGKQDGGVALGDGSVDEDGGGSDAAADAGKPFVDTKEGTDCEEGDKPESCFPDTDHPEMFVTGLCRAGMRTCGCPGAAPECEQRVWSDCVGLILPEDEMCDGKDNDCDGENDEDVEMGGSCVVLGQKGVCAEGEEQCDRDRGVATCGQTKTATAEECIGKDDDCDDETDEDTEQQCYPDDMIGCTKDATSGLYTCKGLCAAGTQTCDTAKGRPGPCMDAVTPETEVCGVTPAVNEDCDDDTDEACPCDEGMTYPCYGGKAATAGKGRCVAGLQTCTGGKLGSCDGQVLPRDEACSNDSPTSPAAAEYDDDCDGSPDDVPDRGDPCTVLSNKGECQYGTLQCQGDALTCVTIEMTDEICNNKDDDCDGKVDNGFDLQTDPKNCGECGHACDGGMVCCGGHCANTQNDANYCGNCNMRCGAGGICCSGQCKNSNSDAHNCKTCGHDCTLLGLGSCCSGTCATLGCGG